MVQKFENVATPLCLGNISEDFSKGNMKKTGLVGSVFDFSVDYNAIAVDNILDIHKYLMKKNGIQYKMFGFIKKVRSGVINIDSNEPLFSSFSILVNKCSASCNNINDPFAKLCVPDVFKGINVKVFNLMSRTNETRYIGWHETFRCKSRLDASVCNNKHRWNNDKCKCECKELIDKGICDKGFIWNPSNCECECEKSCHIGPYLDYENCKFRKKLVDKLVKECSENMEMK